MPNIVPAAQQISNILSVYRQMREFADPGPTGGEQWRMQQDQWAAQQKQAKQLAIQQQKQQKFNEAKSLMSMMLQNYQQAKDDPMLRAHLQRSMMSIHGRINSVDPGMGKLLEAFVKNTPGSKQAYEKTMWLNANPAPNITATWEDDPHARATQEFTLSDWRARFGSLFGGGKGTPKRNLLPTGMTTKVGDKEEAIYAYRNKDGTTELMTDDQLGLRGIASGLGINQAELITNGGYYSKEERVVELNGKKNTYKQFTTLPDLINSSGKAGPSQLVPIKEEIGSPDPGAAIRDERLRANYAKINKDFMDIAAGTTKGASSASIAFAVEKALETYSPEWVIENMLKPRYEIPLLQIVALGANYEKPQWYNLGQQGTTWAGGQAVFKYFSGVRATNTVGTQLDFFWRKGADGSVYLCDKVGNPVPPDQVKEIMKKNGIGLPGVDYSPKEITQ